MTHSDATDIAVRAAGPEDVRRLSLISDATFLETFAGIISGDALVAHCGSKHSPDTLRAILESGGAAWLAELSGAPVGYAMLTTPELEAAREGDVELKKIYVLSRFHGSGIALQLLNAAVKHAAGLNRLLLGVKADNHRAIAFYHKQGFDEIGTRRFDVGGTLYDDIVLARDLKRT